MEHTFKILREDKLILRKMRGTILLKDYSDIIKEGVIIEKYNLNYSVILDYRDTTLIGNIPEFTTFLKKFDKKMFHNNTKLIIINSPRVYVLYNLFKDLLGLKKTVVFYSPTAALKHLGLLNAKALDFLDSD